MHGATPPLYAVFMAGCLIKHKDDFIISVERLGARFEVKTAVLLEIQTFCDAGFVS
jgi:hypothetical protein